MTIKVISNKNLPARLPILSTSVMYLLLDKFNAVGWVWGAIGVLYLLIWITQIVLLIKQEQVDLFKKNSNDTNNKH